MMKSNSLSIPIIVNCKKNKTVETLALIDSGAGGKFIDQNYAKESGFTLENLEKPLWPILWMEWRTNEENLPNM